VKTLIAAAVVLVTALAVPAALAGPGGPPTFHINQRDTGVDADFCGTGKPVAFDGRTTATSWVGETGGELQELKVTISSKTTLTNPAKGDAVIDSVAAQFTNEIIIGLESGPHTHEGTVHGLPEKLQRANGSVLIRDAGTLTFRVSYDEDDNVTGLEIVKDAGSHGGFATGRWCQVAIAELGL
jgi:hypothetical protein